MGRFQLELIYLHFPPSFHQRVVVSEKTEVTSTPTRPVDNVVITTKGLQKQQLFDGRTVGNEGKLILTEIFPSAHKHEETEVRVTSTPTRPVDNVVITTKGLQDRNNNSLMEGRWKIKVN